MTTIVFGDSGFLGSYVADALSAAGHSVTRFDCCCVDMGQRLVDCLAEIAETSSLAAPVL